MTKRSLPSLDLAALSHVTGGTGGVVDIGSINMGPPKYSAAWYEWLRTRGPSQGQPR
ncbi:MAG TPA: hypothetical protein VGL61_08475 [Kofleriaceae bacterium]|jgi:hypothetical protein